MKIKENDQVLIISGKDKGKKGKILRAFPKEERIFVEGVNMRKKHQRPKKQGEKGQIILMPGAVSVSNVKLICSKCGKPTRVGFKISGKTKVRVCKKCDQEV
ncbi:MAG: 50S ribosomal protein L24 [Candidatus Nealsonbacteria bacterium]